MTDTASETPDSVNLPVDFDEWNRARQWAWIAAWARGASEPAPLASESVSTPDRSGIEEWHERALAGVKRLHEDEELRLSLNARLS